ncbi:MAG: fibronectin type III domain-containing protein [Paludibacteraceae bacterium]|nr:fibronectin type III domain-containing protein [Paludibacteraceae bacterium]
MKKNLLLTLVSLLVFNAAVWGEYTKTIQSGETSIGGYGKEKEYSIGFPCSKITFQAKRSSLLAVGNLIVYGYDKNNTESKVYDENPGTSYGSKSANLQRALKVKFKTASLADGTRYFKSVVVTQAEYFDVTTTPLDFGNVIIGKTSDSQSISVEYSKKSGNVSSNNSAFSVSATSVGSTANEAYGTQTVNVTFKPTTPGAYNGTITIGNQTVSVSGTGVLDKPANLGVVMDYTKATLSWNAVSGAEKYIITYGDSTKTTTGTSIVCDGLHLGTQYTFFVKAFANNTTSAAAEISDKTKDLVASASITVSNPSYSSVEAQWAAIADATGYKIVSNNGVVNVFDGHDVTSGTLVGLMPNNTYTFTIYGMYGEEVSLNGKTSGEIKTLETKCSVETIPNKTIESKGGFNWDDAYAECTTTKNNATITFSYTTSSSSATDIKFSVDEYRDGGWHDIGWSVTGSWRKVSGTKSLTLSRGVTKFRFVYHGNFGASFTNISAMQGSYLEVPETTVDFGNVGIGEKPSKDIVVNYSTMVGDVSKEGSDKFSVDKKQVGKDDCGYGSENIKVTFDASTIGEQTGTIKVGSINVTIKANVTLPVPTLEASDITYTSAKLSWNAVPGAEKYRLNFIGGNSIETTDTWSVCDTLKLHSSNQFTVQAYGGGQYTDPSNVVTVSTPDLVASASFSVSNPSYTSVIGAWAKIPDATGYKVVASNGAETIFDGGNTISGHITGLMPNNTYTFTVYGMYNGDVSLNSTSSENSATTLKTNCPVQDVPNKTLGNVGQGFKWGWSYEFDVKKNSPILSFSYSVFAGVATTWTGDLFEVYEYVDGKWSETGVWGTNNRSGSATNIQLSRNATKIRLYCSGNFGCTFNGISVMQGSYFEASPTSLDLGSVLVGGTISAKTVTIDYSTMKGDIISDNDKVFICSKNVIGADDCGYGKDNFNVSVNTNVEPGTYESNIQVGSIKIPVKLIVIPLPAPAASASGVGKNTINISWPKVDGATAYKVVCESIHFSTIKYEVEGQTMYNVLVNSLEENKEYEFRISTMYGDIENQSSTLTARTFASLNIEKEGVSKESISYTIQCKGNWNEGENSFEKGSEISIIASNSDNCAKYEKTVIGSETITENPAVFTISEPVTATIYYTDKELTAPTLNVICNSKNKAELSWNANECAETYTIIYVNSDGKVKEISNITTTNYAIEDLTPATDYTFKVEAVRGELNATSDEVSVTTYGTVDIQASGVAPETTSWTLTGEEGKWNEIENSFEIGSTVTIFASNSDASAVFDKMQYYDGESTINPTAITMLNASVSKTWANVFFKYSGVAKTDDGHEFATLSEAIEYSKTHNVEITLLTDCPTENIDLESGTNVVLDGNGFRVGDVTVRSGAKLTTNGALIMGNLNIKTEYRNSGEVDPNGQDLDVIGTVSFDKILDPSGVIDNSVWYGVCVPFPVDIKDVKGVLNNGDEVPLAYGVNVLFDRYDGDMRAAKGKGWVDMPASETLVPGKMYILLSDYNTVRFYKKDGTPIVSDLTSIQLQEFTAPKIENQGWNAIGNSQIFHVGMSSETVFGQTLVQGTKAYDLVSLEEENFVVASPVFIQYIDGGKNVELFKKQSASLRSVAAENDMFNLRIAKEGQENAADQMFITASEFASDDYVIGKDLAKMGDLTGVNMARIWMNAKSTKLCVIDAKLYNGTTEIPLGVFAPKNGNYKLYLNSNVYGLTLELLYNGEIIHNFADGEFTTAIAKGTNNGYSLKISANADAPVITDVDGVEDIKAYIKENTLYITGLNDGAEYTVYDLHNKIADRIANGGIEQVDLPLQGVYFVISGETTIKLLNK